MIMRLSTGLPEGLFLSLGLIGEHNLYGSAIGLHTRDICSARQGDKVEEQPQTRSLCTASDFSELAGAAQTNVTSAVSAFVKAVSKSRLPLRLVSPGGLLLSKQNAPTLSYTTFAPNRL